MSPIAISEPKITQKCIGGLGSARTLLGELTAVLARPRCWILGRRWRREGRERNGRESGEGNRGEEWDAPGPLCLQHLDYDLKRDVKLQLTLDHDAKRCAAHLQQLRLVLQCTCVLISDL